MIATGNTRLVDYGIQNEQSDLRAHVCPLVKSLYVYPTSAGRACIESGKYKVKEVTNISGIITARGAPVPTDHIDGCMRVEIPDELLERFAISEYDSTSAKGNNAVAIVTAMIEEALFPFPLQPSIITGVSLQHAGLDIVVSANVRIQVKCDYRGGCEPLGGTGNLFLQIAECNPLRSY